MKKFIAFITAALMAVSMAVPAMAAETAPEGKTTEGTTPAAQTEEKVNYPLVDPSKKGTITVGLYRRNASGSYDTENPVSGIPLSLYQVAKVENETNVGYHFVYKDDFSTLETSLPLDKNEDVNFSDQKSDGETQTPVEKYVAAIEKIIDEKGLKPSEEEKTDDKGIVKFQGEKKEQASGADEYEGLEVGVYLVRQTQAVAGYQTIKSFLVTIPQKEIVKDEEGKDSLKYNVDASPKVEPVVPVNPYNPGPGPNPNPNPTPNPTKELTGNKVIEGGAREKESTFTFELTPVQSDSPMPSGSKDGKATAKITGAGKIDFGKIEFKTAGDYVYTVKEVAGEDKDYQYDSNTYYVVYHVKKGANNALEVEEPKIYTDEKLTQPANGDAALTFTNKYEKKGTADPSVQKVIKVVSGQAPNTATTFSFTLTPGKADNPMPTGTENGKKTISIPGSGRIDFGTITFEKEGTYEYTVKEDSSKQADRYTYDKTEYKIVYTVDDKLNVTKVVMNGQKKVSDGDTVTVTNEYRGPVPVKPGNPVRPSRPTSRTTRTATPTTTPARTVKKASVLPQTGQLWWPVWVLAAAGGVLVVSGMLKKKKNA